MDFAHEDRQRFDVFTVLGVGVNGLQQYCSCLALLDIAQVDPYLWVDVLHED
jgi:hypothetical protein